MMLAIVQGTVEAKKTLLFSREKYIVVFICIFKKLTACCGSGCLVSKTGTFGWNFLDAVLQCFTVLQLLASLAGWQTCCNKRGCSMLFPASHLIELFQKSFLDLLVFFSIHRVQKPSLKSLTAISLP